ncbi:MAG: hypothetical protein FWE61_00285 [Micrococcales bacterium]|nr:hypothetical protein [Micrococcales bacterium]
MTWVTLVEGGPIELVRRRLEEYLEHNPFLADPDLVLLDMIRTETGDILRVRVRADVADAVMHLKDEK